MKLTPEQIQSNWDKLIQLIENTFEGERQEKLLKLYDDLNKEFSFDFEFLRSVFFVNKVPIEEHIFTIPHNQHSTAWWGHPYMDDLKDKLSIKFYGC